jgi:hypothetical protein
LQSFPPTIVPRATMLRFGGSQEIGRSRACGPDTKQTNVEIARTEPSSGDRCILILFPRSIESSI